MRTISKDILSVEKGAIGHQVNCLGLMGAGLAAEIRKKYPVVYSEYLSYVYQHSKRFLLGNVQAVTINSRLECLNIFGQLDVGTNYIRTNYQALTTAAEEIRLKQELGSMTERLYLPHSMGCGLGGGDWEVVQDIFKDVRGYWCLNEK